jgi:hypothetical protein
LPVKPLLIQSSRCCTSTDARADRLSDNGPPIPPSKVTVLKLPTEAVARAHLAGLGSAR